MRPSDSPNNRKQATLVPFLLIGLLGGGLLAFLMTHISSSPIGILSFATPQSARSPMHLLFYDWISFYGVMFLLSWPTAQSVKRLIFITLIPSVIASVPYYWRGDNTTAQFFLTILSAYALNAFHMNYEANGFHIHYSTLFHAVWDTFVKLFITLFFTLLCWIILYLCGALFNFIDIKFLSQLIEKSWFSVWVTAFFVSMGLYIVTHTDNVVRNMRMVLLLICKFLFIPLAIISIIFIASLLVMMHQHHFTFKSESLFSSIAFLSVLFLNGIYQGGLAEKPYPAVFNLIGRIFIGITPVFVGLAIYTVYSQGLDSHNFACFLNLSLLLVYTIAYAIIAFLPQKSWFKGIETTNIVLAIVLILMTVVTTTPWFTDSLNYTEPSNPIPGLPH